MPSRLGPLVFAVVLPLTTTVVLLPGEFTHYKRFLELGADQTGLRVAVLAAILSKTLLPVLLGLGLLVLGGRFAGPRTLRSLSFALSVFVLGFLSFDLELQKNTGNNIINYVPFLFDSDTFLWAGQAFDVGPSTLRVARNLMSALVPAGILAWLVERWVAGSPERRGRAVLFILGSLGLLLLVAAPLLRRTWDAPGIYYHLDARMPWTWASGVGTEQANISASQRDAQQLYARLLPKLAEPRSFAHLIEKSPPPVRPDILVVAIESLRHDMLTPDTMPRLWKWSENGVRLDTHYATSNASHYGMFALLFGRSPLFYYETLDSGEPPTLPAQLREWGYTNHYVTCTDIQWREMDRFMGPDHFSVEQMVGTSLDACDRDVMSRAASLLEPSARAPRFVLVFLMSTHFGYHFPAGEEPFQPSISPPNALELDAEGDHGGLINRYRNSAHYLDSLIGQLLDRVVPEKALVVVTGDHGESLFDDGTIAHSSLLSEIQTRVPLAIMGPGVQPGNARRGPTDHSDLLPTLLARLGVGSERLEAYPGRDLLRGDGPPFVPLIQSKSRRGGEDRLALVSARNRYSIRLDAERGELRFLGKMEPNGHPSPEPISEVEGATAVRWLDRYLESVSSR